jgi:2-dehydro-3-deoxyphosphogluconate aldolase / (4S)-4-hydroxy-2-oxoglutarate aldolase
MSLKENESYFSQARVLPVLTPESVASAVAVSRVLFEAGLRMQEITLRTEWALGTITALVRELPELIVGAGSVVRPELGEAAIQAGARFLVSPGLNETLLQYASDCRVPFLPGVSTVSESMRVMTLGCTAAKLFPADALGGVAFLRCVAAPLPSMKFCPSGGIDAKAAPDYLRLANVLGIGGSWMAPAELVRQNRFAEIRKLAEQAAAL